MPKKDQQEEISWEQTVSRFLGDNPDFFTHHPELLSDISIPHPDAGSAVSLIERQVGVLREQKLQLERQLRELISNARENEVLSGRLHDFARHLLRADSLDVVLGPALTRLRDAFHLDAISVRIVQNGVSDMVRPELVDENNEQFIQLALLLANREPVCGSFLDQPQKDFLFSRSETEIKSCALLPLKTKNVRGIFCLGSQDPHRFEQNMATDYLNRLSDLVACTIERHLATP
ncbi:MAG: DUF484 family protein [Acidiferrobacterales bacterium]